PSYTKSVSWQHHHNAGILRIYLLQFSAIVGYKTRRAA
ncbi:hypothetical protein Q2454_07490, partial [Escherichia coli]|nr:hypothetical protein [Escherichia coli]